MAAGEDQTESIILDRLIIEWLFGSWFLSCLDDIILLQQVGCAFRNTN